MWRVLLALISVCQVQPLKISVYYESLCPDSINFVDNQLFPVYKRLGNVFQLDLVPYGKASSSNESGRLVFKCQHGPKECYGNKIHACAVSQNSVEESTEFVYCSMKNTNVSVDSDTVFKKCSNSSGIAWKSLRKCYESGKADMLLLKNAKKTSTLKPPLSFVPTITFDGRYSQTNQDAALEDLLEAVCEMLKYEPEGCRKWIDSEIEVVELR